MSKRPIGSAYVGNLINYLWSFPDSFPWGLYIDLEGSSTFLALMLSMLIDRLDLFSHLYGTLFICITECLGSCISATALCMEVGWCCTAAMSAWCSAHQLAGYECTVKRSHTPLKY